MRILVCSHAFAPSIGGIETAASILAGQFIRAGAKVTVVTDTPGEGFSDAYEVIRRPSLKRLRQLGRDSDIIFQNNISLRTLVPLLSCRKPVVVAHQTWLTRTNGRRSWQDYMKLAVLPLCHNISISKAIGASLPAKSIVIGNPFESEEFSEFQDAPRTKDIVFLGRLVSDKGCDLVLRSLVILRNEGICPTLSVLGDGPELPALKRLCDELGLNTQVDFRGSIVKGRGREVSRHRIMVIPSMWAEPFGMVALEGLAAGCVVVASSAGGLPEAIGPCGILFPNGDASALAAALRDLITKPGLREELIAKSTQHLEGFKPEIVAGKYLDVFRSLLSR
jgi:glycosyltransferase involved in cell wall biosynthesis